MPDIRERLQSLHDLDVPDVWGDARSRTPRSDPGEPSVSRSRKALVMVTALALGLAAVGVVVRAFGDAQPASYWPSDAWPTTEVEPLGLALKSPPSWKVQRFEEDMKIHFAGVLVSNTDDTFQHSPVSDGGATTAWDMRVLPLDGVAVAVEEISGGPPPATDQPDPPDSEFPLSIDDAKVLPVDDSATSTPHPGPAVEHVLSFTLDGRGMDVRFWIGPEATPQDRRALAEVIASIGPVGAPDPEGTATVVPELVGLGDQAAFRTLDRLGLRWEAAYRDVPGERWHVVQMDPSAGSSVDPGSRVRLLIATEVTRIAPPFAAALSCGPEDRVAFGGPRLVLLPGGEAFIRANVGGIERSDKVLQATFGDAAWHGLWHVVRDGDVIAIVDFESLDGVSCAGSNVAAT